MACNKKIDVNQLTILQRTFLTLETFIPPLEKRKMKRTSNYARNNFVKITLRIFHRNPASSLQYILVTDEHVRLFICLSDRQSDGHT